MTVIISWAIVVVSRIWAVFCSNGDFFNCDDVLIKYFYYFCSRNYATHRPDGGMVDTRDLKSLGHCGCAGSSPALGTLARKAVKFFSPVFYVVLLVMQNY